MSFQLSPLPAREFNELYGRSDEVLAGMGVVVQTADAKPGFPCRVSLCDAEPGQRMLLVNYEHQKAATPFRASHAVYVIDGARQAAPAIGEVPEQLSSRLLSVRGFSSEHMMLAAEVVDGHEAAGLFDRMLEDDRIGYLHVHYARQGCYAARVDRA